VSANHRVETLMDATGRGMNVEVRCIRCGKRRVLDSTRLLKIWMRRGWPMRIGRLHEHLRCDRCRPVDIHVRVTGDQPDGRRQPQADDE
jgi:hypothetical protein